MPLDTLSRRAPRLAATVTRMGAPPIPACRAWAAAYDGACGPLLDLTQAVPGYPPPPKFLERLGNAAASRAAAGYGLLEGETSLREAMAQELARLYGADAAAEDVRITAGANMGFTLAMNVLTAPGDAVLLPAPWFFNHQMALALRGVEAVPLPCDATTGFLPDPDHAAALLHPRVRALVLVTPNNPTGAVMSPGLIERFAELCRNRGIWLVLDETYRDFLPPDAAPHTLFQRSDWRDFVVQLYSFSKAYCIPGHRVGAVAAGPAFMAEFIKAVDNIQICPPRAAQIALAWAVPALRDWRAANAALMARRGSAFLAVLATASGWHVEAHGAYFAWLRVPEGGPDGLAVAEHLARHHGLVTLPGSFFGPGGERHLRLAFANLDDAVIPDVGRRLAEA